MELSNLIGKDKSVEEGDLFFIELYSKAYHL
jgi:hypothetical protein